MVLLLVAASPGSGSFHRRHGYLEQLAQWIVTLPLHRHVIMFFIFMIYIIGGSFIDDVAFMILATPIFFPSIYN